MQSKSYTTPDCFRFGLEYQFGAAAVDSHEHLRDPKSRLAFFGLVDAALCRVCNTDSVLTPKVSKP